MVGAFCCRKWSIIWRLWPLCCHQAFSRWSEWASRLTFIPSVSARTLGSCSCFTCQKLLLRFNSERHVHVRCACWYEMFWWHDMFLYPVSCWVVSHLSSSCLFVTQTLFMETILTIYKPYSAHVNTDIEYFFSLACWCEVVGVSLLTWQVSSLVSFLNGLNTDFNESHPSNGCSLSQTPT